MAGRCRWEPGVPTMGENSLRRHGVALGRKRTKIAWNQKMQSYPSFPIRIFFSLFCFPLLHSRAAPPEAKEWPFACILSRPLSFWKSLGAGNCVVDDDHWLENPPPPTKWLGPGALRRVPLLTWYPQSAIRFFLPLRFGTSRAWQRGRSVFFPTKTNKQTYVVVLKLCPRNKKQNR